MITSTIFSHRRRIAATLSVAALLVLATVAFRPAVARAGAHSSHVPSQANTAAAPFCSGGVDASPYSQDLGVNQWATLVTRWSCEGGVHVVVNVDWGDGSSSSYTCWANYGSGSTTFAHQYTRPGAFTIKVSMSGFASGNDTAYADVS